MRKFFVIYMALITISIYTFENYAQCSDAGVCQIGGHTTESESERPLSFSFAYKFGYSGKDDDVKFHTFQLNGSYNFLSDMSVQVAVPYNIQSGPRGEVSGIGDLILSLNHKILLDKNSFLDVSAGAKLATGDDNKDNLPLPQVYQSGLGTNDFLFALNYTYDKISVGAGYQLAGGRNNNIFRLERGDDLLLRAAYQLSFDEISITPQLLFIKRLSKSTIADFNTVTERFVEVDKSDQTQLNLLTHIQYQVAEGYSFFADFAVPFIKREVNVDGLTRAFSASFGVRFLF
jgi:hypothetical protein